MLSTLMIWPSAHCPCCAPWWHSAHAPGSLMQNGSRRKPPAHGAELTTPSPNLPSVGKQRSKIPSASPSRINRPSPGRSRIPVIAGSEGSPSLGRDASPGAGGWSMFTKNDSKPKTLVSVCMISQVPVALVKGKTIFVLPVTSGPL